MVKNCTFQSLMLFLAFFLAQTKIFVFLWLIVRGKMLCIRRSHIRAVEGNLCLYPNMQNLENFEVDIRYESASLICIHQLLCDTYRLGKRIYFTSKVFSRACQSK